jgi:glycosyltransferase involved in cell wall biosynthesis
MVHYHSSIEPIDSTCVCGGWATERTDSMHDCERRVPRGREAIVEAYSRLFGDYRDRPIALLELGSDGASSLCHWAARFPNAATIIGCVGESGTTIEQLDDPRLLLIVGDPDDEDVRRQVLSHQASFDVIVDAGRYRVRNVVPTFSSYFPHLRAGGLYLLEDLRSSPWLAYGGGMFNPFSSAGLFRRLADTLSIAGCGLASPRTDALAALASYYGVSLTEELLATIHSVEFLSSACAVRRRCVEFGVDRAAGSGSLPGGVCGGTGRQDRSPWPSGEGFPHGPDQSAADARASEDAVACLDAYHSSWIWPLARAAMRVERRWPTLCRAAVAAPRLIWWALTGRLRERLRLRRQARNVLAAGFFDAAWYARRYPTVVLDGQVPLLEWLREGWRSGRDPHPQFNNAEYLRDHPEVVASGLNPIEHYVRVGRPQAWLLRRVGDDYPEWIRRFDCLSARARGAVRGTLPSLEHAPRISVLMSTCNAQERWLRHAVESVRRQIYPHWELCIVDDASTEPGVRGILEEYAALDSRIRISFRTGRGGVCVARNEGLSRTSGDYVAFLDEHDILAEHALYLIARGLSTRPHTDIVYSDEDRVDASGSRHSPYFKPDFNAELFYSTGYLGHLGVLRRSLVESVGGFRPGLEGESDFDLVLRCVAQTPSSRIWHVPRILYHRRDRCDEPQAVPASNGDNERSGVCALSDFFRSQAEPVEVGFLGAGVYRLRFPIPRPAPLVSIIIPTRNKDDLLRRCVESVLGKTTYPAYEVVVVDNRSDEPAALSYLEELRGEPRCRVLRFNAPFNYSAINNSAVSDAQGDFVLLLNNDTEVITPDWLGELVMWGVRAGVGSVGCMLRYPDGTVQHAGVLLGVRGNASHYHKHAPLGSRGYFGRLASVHEVGGNTAACLLVRKEHYVAVGGLDEENLPVSFNDVDFCLRLRSVGLRNLWTPHAELYHHESKSRGREDGPDTQARALAEGAFLRWRWGSSLLEDPAYNPNLTLEREDFSLAWPPRVPPLCDDLAAGNADLAATAPPQAGADGHRCPGVAVP